MEVSKNIRLIRERKGFTQVDMANRLGTERSNYARLENRDINLTLKQIQEIADALEVSIYEIIGKPESTSVHDKQTDTFQRLEERLKMTEDVLKEKKKNIKYYKSFIEWTRNMFCTQFVLATLHAAQSLELREIDIEGDDELDLTLIARYGFDNEEFKAIGDYMFSYKSPDYFLTNFVAESGFVTEKWFVDAYKRRARARKEKINSAEVRNWVNGVFEFLRDE